MANEFKIKKGLIVTGASGGTVVDIQGSQGQLFSVTDDLSGSIFAVSDISGVPIFTVNSSGLSTFDGNIIVGDSHFIGNDSFDNLLLQSSSGENLNLSSSNDIIFYTGGTTPDALGTQRLRIFNSNGSATFTGKVRANDWFQGADSTNTLYSAVSLGTLLQAPANSGTGGSIYLRNNSGTVFQEFSQVSGGISSFNDGKVTSLATAASDGSTTLTTKSYVDGLVTGVPVYKGTWAAGTTGVTSAAINGTTITLTAAPTETIAIGDVVTADGIIAATTVTAVASQTSVTVSATVVIATGITVTFSPEGGYPDLTLAAAKVLGNYYIVSTAGSAAPNGSGVEPDSWAVGDWCIFSDVTPGAGTDLWQRIDNSSVISGAGTGGTIPLWEGATNAVSETLGNAPITVSGSNATFAGNVTLSGQAAPQLFLDSNTGGTPNYTLIANASSQFIIGRAGVSNDFILDSGNATFAGDVNVQNNATRIISLNYEDSVNSIISHSGNNFGLESLNVRGDTIRFYTDYDASSPKGNLTLTLDTSHNATFAGTITSGNITVNGSSRALVVKSSNDQVVSSFVCDGNAISTIGFKGNTGANDYNVRIGADGSSLVAYTVNTVRMTINSSGNTTFAGDVKWSGGVGRLVSNQLQSGYNQNADNTDFWINYTGYQGGSTYFRDFRIGDGKQNQVAFFDGSTKNATFAGSVGIGVTPTVPLDISAVEGTIKLTSSTGTNFTSIRTVNTGGTLYQGIERSTGGVLGLTAAYEAFLFYTADNPLLIGTANSYVRFATNSTERMRIDSAGNVGIGITNPNSYDSNADNLVIGSTGANDKNGITIVGGDTDGRGAVYFADTTQNSAGYISYFHSNNSMLFGTSDTTRMVIDSAGNVQFSGATSNTTVISMNTADGSDTKQLSLAGGGADTDGQGARMRLFGNEHATNGGVVDLSTGNIAGADMHLRAKDLMLLYTGGSERMRITSGGDVGIGTADGPDDVNSKLHVYKNAGANTVVELLRLDCGENNHLVGKGGSIIWRDIDVYTNTASITAQRTGNTGNSTLQFGLRGSEKMRIDSAGAIKFNAYGAGTLVSDASGNITVSSGGGAGGPYLPLAGGTMTLATSPLILPGEESNQFKIAFTGASASSGLSTVDQSGAGLYIGANSRVNNSGVVVYHDSALPSSGIYFDGWNGDDMEFYTGSSGNPTKRLTIQAGGDAIFTGNVGIGTTSPATDLHINSENAEGSLTLSRSGNNMVSGQGVGSIVFPADYNGTPTNYGKIVTYANALSALRGSIDLKVKSTSGNLLTGLTVYGTSSGVNVGIGTTSPDGQLDVTDGNSKMVFDGASSDRPLMYFQHNAVPVDGEEVGLFDFRGYNSASQDTRYVIWTAKAEDVTDGSEDGSLTLMTMKDGTATTTLIGRSGKVAIGGTVSPSQALDVTGKIRLTDDIQLDSTSPRIDFDNGVAGSLRFFSTSQNATKLSITSAGAIQFNAYDSTNNTGTPTYLLGTDASGNIVKTLSSSAPGSLWAASGNDIYNTNSANVGIGTSSPNNFTNQKSLTINGIAGGNARLDLKLNDVQKGAIISSSTAMIIDAGANFLQFYTGSNEHMRIDSSGNVGIGMTNTSNAKLNVDGSILLDSSPEIRYSLTSGGPYLNVRSKDSGTSACGIKIHSPYGSPGYFYGEGSGSGSSSYIGVLDGGGNWALQIRTGTSTSLWANGSNRLHIDSAGSVGIGTTLPAAKLDVFSAASFRADVATGNPLISVVNNTAISNTAGTATIKFTQGNTQAGGKIVSGRDGNYSSGATRTSNLQFYTSTAASDTEKMRITSAGNVGIGTTTPLAKLDIQGTQGQLFSVTDDLSGSIFAVADISGVPIFDVNSSGVSYFDGNVGIGETTPNCKLDVKGVVNTTIIAATTLGDGGGAANRGLAIRTLTDGGEIITVGSSTNM